MFRSIQQIFAAIGIVAIMASAMVGCNNGKKSNQESTAIGSARTAYSNCVNRMGGYNALYCASQRPYTQYCSLDDYTTNCCGTGSGSCNPQGSGLNNAAAVESYFSSYLSQIPADAVTDLVNRYNYIRF